MKLERMFCEILVLLGFSKNYSVKYRSSRIGNCDSRRLCILILREAANCDSSKDDNVAFCILVCLDQPMNRVADSQSTRIIATL
jgi:hypothetical protein